MQKTNQSVIVSIFIHIIIHFVCRKEKEEEEEEEEGDTVIERRLISRTVALRSLDLSNNGLKQLQLKNSAF